MTLPEILARHDDADHSLWLWLEELSRTCLAYGADLAVTHRDGTWAAERALVALEAAGLVERGANPTVDHSGTRGLIFFGVGGFAGGAASVKSRTPVIYGFAPGRGLRAALTLQ